MNFKRLLSLAAWLGQEIPCRYGTRMFSTLLTNALFLSTAPFLFLIINISPALLHPCVLHVSPLLYHPHNACVSLRILYGYLHVFSKPIEC